MTTVRAEKLTKGFTTIPNIAIDRLLFEELGVFVFIQSMDLNEFSTKDLYERIKKEKPEFDKSFDWLQNVISLLIFHELLDNK